VRKTVFSKGTNRNVSTRARAGIVSNCATRVSSSALVSTRARAGIVRLLSCQ